MAPGRWPAMPREVASGLCFCVTSAAMTLLNKAALSAFHFTAPTVLLCFQCSLSLALVGLAAAAGATKVPPLSPRLLLLWLPVNVLFVGMVWTSFFALRHLSVPMVTVLKNLTSLLVILGDLAFFGKRYSWGVWATLGLMLASALCSAATDLSFDARGYAWQLVNNAFTAAYSLWLRGVMGSMAAQQQQQQGGGGPGRADELAMVVYNNLLSVPMIAAIAVLDGEVAGLGRQRALSQPAFLLAAAGSGLTGFAISVASMWFLSCTTATTFSLVGSLNKIPLAVVGMALFKAPVTVNNLLSVLVGLAAGVVFAYAKATDGRRPSQAGLAPHSKAPRRRAQQQALQGPPPLRRLQAWQEQQPAGPAAPAASGGKQTVAHQQLTPGGVPVVLERSHSRGHSKV